MWWLKVGSVWGLSAVLWGHHIWLLIETWHSSGIQDRSLTSQSPDFLLCKGW